MSLLSRFKRAIGPGVITGIADDDPSGIVTYAQTGAIFGLSQLWMTLYTIPLMIAVQEMCARVGMVTGMGIAGVIKKYYSKKLLFCAVFLLTIANTINIGADIGAMGEVVHLVSPLSSGVALIIITIFTIVVIVVTPYHLYAKILKYFAASVLAYVVAAFFITQDWSKVALSTIIPHIEWNKNFLFNMTAFLGTTISPYLFFWQADEEVEEAIDTKKIEGFGKGRPEVTSSNVSTQPPSGCGATSISKSRAFASSSTRSRMGRSASMDRWINRSSARPSRDSLPPNNRSANRSPSMD